MPRPLLFTSQDPGAPVLSGTNGALIEVLSASLIVNRVFATADDTTFTDNTAEARLAGGTAFTLFPTPGTGDRTYIGMSTPFDRVSFVLATVGAGGAFVWEYWNGTAWTSLTVTDGTSGFTQSGTVTWTIPSNWASRSVNGVSLYWVRVRPTTAPSTNPTVNRLTVTGWHEAFSATNVRVYRMGGPIGFYLRVQDDGPGAGLAREARVRGWETKADTNDVVDANNTGPFPTVASFATGRYVRKSATADATARPWVLIADDRTFYMGAGSEGTTFTTQAMYAWGFGEIFSTAGSADAYRVFLIARNTENNNTNLSEGLCRIFSGVAAPDDGFLARSYSGTGGAIGLIRPTSLALPGGASSFVAAKGAYSTSVVPNQADSAYYLAPLWAIESSTGSPIRGRLRGIQVWQLNSLGSSVPLNGDTLSGTGAYAGRTWYLVRATDSVNSVQSHGGFLAFETSDTWETNT